MYMPVLNPRKNSRLKGQGSKTGLYYKASFLPGQSIIFLLFITCTCMSKLEVNG